MLMLNVIFQFAKEFLKTRQISTVQTSAEAAMEAQLHIARTLLVYKGQSYHKLHRTRVSQNCIHIQTMQRLYHSAENVYYKIKY